MRPRRDAVARSASVPKPPRATSARAPSVPRVKRFVRATAGRGNAPGYGEPAGNSSNVASLRTCAVRPTRPSSGDQRSSAPTTTYSRSRVGPALGVGISVPGT